MKKENKADKVIDGKKIAQEIEENVKGESSTYRETMEFLVGDDEKPKAITSHREYCMDTSA